MVQRISSDNELGFQRVDVLETVLESLTAKERAKSPSEADKRAQQARQSHSRLHDLVHTFKRNLISDEPYLNFNYLGFWSALFELNVDMTNANALWTKRRSKQYPELMIPWGMAYHLLHDAASRISNGQALAEAPIAKAAAIMNEHIAATGNNFSQEAFSKSSDRIPKLSRPIFRKYHAPQTAAVLSMLLESNPGAKLHLSPSYVTIYDPNGSQERFDCAVELAHKGSNATDIDATAEVLQEYKKRCGHDEA